METRWASDSLENDEAKMMMPVGGEDGTFNLLVGKEPNELGEEVNALVESIVMEKKRKVAFDPEDLNAVSTVCKWPLLCSFFLCFLARASWVGGTILISIAWS